MINSRLSNLLLFLVRWTVFKNECKRIFSSCVSLFSYQGPCLSTAISDYHIFSGLSRTFFRFLEIFFFQVFPVLFDSFNRLSQTSFFVKNFFDFFFKTVSGERGIWTLAPLLTTYSLSRGAPSASLGTSPKRRGWDSNPRALSDKRFSRPPRYDHFDTSPYIRRR